MYLDREQLEHIETQTLAPYALLSGKSRGRVHPESEPDYRTAFQRDRDRIVHSAAFRRLEYKTQVFVNDEGDYYRTRLTHTLEVAQIGRTVARALGVNEDLVEAICLAHDLGHPPFGHAGETVLNALMEGHGGFNHNHQSYRVVTELEQRYPQWRGLNLTHETLEGLAKHESSYDLSRVANLDPQLRGSLEAQIADVVDELAYSAHDLDDGLRAGLIAPEALHTLDVWYVLRDRLDWQGGAMNEVTRHTFIRELIGWSVDELLRATSARIAALELQSVADVQCLEANVVDYSEPMKAHDRALRHFLHDHMYQHFRIMRMSARAERFISEMFTALVTEPRQLPPESQADLREKDVYRVVADYIASMTDRSALLEYRRLYDPLMRP